MYSPGHGPSERCVFSLEELSKIDACLRLGSDRHPYLHVGSMNPQAPSSFHHFQGFDKFQPSPKRRCPQANRPSFTCAALCVAASWLLSQPEPGTWWKGPYQAQYQPNVSRR